MADRFDADISGLNRLSADLAIAAGTQGAMAVHAVRKTTLDVVATGQLFAPVDTGNLMNSIGADFEADGHGFEGIAGPTADYGAHVEFGTATRAPAAYMGPAFDRHSHELDTALGLIAREIL